MEIQEVHHSISKTILLWLSQTSYS